MAQKRSVSTPRSSASLVDGTLARNGLGKQARDWRALYAFFRLGGPRLARHTRPETVVGSALLVRVATAAWANELTYLRGELLERLRADPQASWITELRFTIGPLDGLPDFADPETDGTRPPAPLPGPPPLVDAGPVAEALLSIKDPELREALAELFARARLAASAYNSTPDH